MASIRSGVSTSPGGPKHGGWREDQFALDDEGHLIMTTQTRGGRQASVEMKRVYDRVRGATASGDHT